MSDYIRTTRECTLDSLQPALSAAIQKHIERHGLGIQDADILVCCETISTKPKKGLFGKAEVILTGMLVTSHWLVWAAGKENETPVVISARLSDITVQDYETSDFYKMVPDSGLNISGLRTDTPQAGTSFIGLGPEPAAQKFRQVIRGEIDKGKHPAS